MKELIKVSAIIKSGRVWPVGDDQIIVSVCGVKVPATIKVNTYYLCHVLFHTTGRVVFKSKGVLALQPPFKDILGSDISDEVFFLLEGGLKPHNLINSELKILSIGRMLNESEIAEKTNRITFVEEAPNDK